MYTNTFKGRTLDARLIKESSGCWRSNDNQQPEDVEELEHDEIAVSTRPNYGENQATIATAASYDHAAEKAVRQWWKTIRTIGGVGRDRIYQQSFVDTPIDGFTQMAWATTRRLGCAVVKCNGRYNVVCRYSGRGNIVGEEIYKRGRPCSQCPPGTTCDNNLCKWN
ncbi:hypothetical protein ANCDUO_10167 [Ancylostoma duodenale]|uniref:SCP domain-containing protein n=1 Tax=Ancylostoma duodenale TaxID=51022 RepID=A0A0C2GRH3_9BILA|nr:hypothetical protein ANCDUO_10167 [Ancylostoma duodenale]